MLVRFLLAVRIIFAVSASALALAGCSGTLSALHGVGAPVRQAAAPRQAPATGGTAAPVVVTAPAEVAAAASTTDAVQPGPASPNAAKVETVALKPTDRSTPAMTAAEIPPQPDLGATREAAISDIRAKAAATGKKPPNIFDTPQATAEPMSKDEQDAVRRQLEATLVEDDANITPEEAARRLEIIKRLQRKARTHYKRALSSIEN